MKIGLFFGSFNPVHVGHLVIAGFMAEFTDLDQVWFVISPHNPLKEKNTLLKDHHRLAMLRIAIENTPKLKVSNIEFSLPTPSYTINTLVHLEEKHPKHSFVLLMGSDNLHTFHKWKNYEQILENYEMYIYPRKEKYEGKFLKNPKIKFVDAPIMEVSSSFIRQAIKDKKDIRYMLPSQVYEYLKEMHFYEK